MNNRKQAKVQQQKIHNTIQRSHEINMNMKIYH